jgi:hypothetical protein
MIVEIEQALHSTKEEISCDVFTGKTAKIGDN